MSNIPRCSPEEAHKLITDEGYAHVDVRTESEFSGGHASGALNIPFMVMGPRGMAPNPDFMRIMNGLFPKDTKLVVECRSGNRSLRAAEALVADGYLAVVDQRAGFEGPRDAMGRLIERGWKAAGLPVDSTTAGSSYAEIKARLGV